MASHLFFNGRLYTTPTTVTKVDDSAMMPMGLTVGNILALLGRSSGGKPNTVYKFGNPAEAQAVLRSGELLTAVRKAFNPSAELDAPSTVIAIPVGRATPATLTLTDAAAAASILVTSDLYGVEANQLKIKVESGSVRGKKLTTQLGRNYYSADNIARDALTLQYTGSGVAATVTVGNAQLVLSVDGAALDTIDLGSYPTVEQLVDRLNAVAGITAAAIAGSERKPTQNGLDTVSGLDIKGGVATLSAHLQACIDWFNGVGEGFATASRPDGAGAAPANVDWTYLAGGSNPVPTIGDWTDALTTLQGVDCQWVVPLTANPALHAAADAHVSYMSVIARQERRAFVGPDSGTTLDAVKSLPKALNSDRTGLVWPGHYDYDDAGSLVLLPPYMTAAVVAAGFAGCNPGTPLTNKALKLRGLEVSPRNPTDTDDLINAGVLCLEDTPKGYKVVRSVSTWLIDDKYNRVEVSTGVATDFVARNIREALDVLRGQKMSPRLLSRAISITETKLMELARPEPQGPEVIVGDAASPAFRKIRAELAGDVLRVSFECSPVIPNNFIAITVAVVPYSGVATAA
jgi:hypothetical protein